MSNFITLDKLKTKDALEGATVSFFQTDYQTVGYTVMKAGAEVPLHQHPQEAIDIVLEGMLQMTIGESTGILIRGMTSFVPSNVPHTAKAITDCKVITILHPQRKI
ncbi:cupin domain-containing protein [Chitinophaga barathri]|uniref:Cupin domain-containing protein n=1 Tax=Chitinophaga barathri TaxID=1647451 RepID=A0A3N4MD77_9BACT|nr:cupin domain-containing protein [Chitinophaga barathri]RPD39517.1 cupin domain-containing protein [Chitinophaga barathri]